MKKTYLLLATAAMTVASCTNDEYLGEIENVKDQGTNGAIMFSSTKGVLTRSDYVGATAAEKLGGMFVVEGTKGTEQDDSPSTTVVFDNYLVGYTANTAATTESNTHNWEYVGLESGIAGKLSGTTWAALHNNTGDSKVQSIKYWDYSTDQYDFIAWSTGAREAVTDAAVAGSKIKVTRINNGTGLATNGFTMTAMSAADLMECYYTDINTVEKANYNKVVTLRFRNMASKVRVALYETVPGYSVKDVKFYTSDGTDQYNYDGGTVLAAETSLAGYYTLESGVYTACAAGSKADGSTTYYKMTSLKPAASVTATLFTTGDDVLPQSGQVVVYYPSIGKTHRDATPQTEDYNKASVTTNVVPSGATATTQAFGALTAQYRAATGNEKSGDKYLGLTLPTATFAGDATQNFYQAVIPNTTGKALTLRVDYTLVSTDGSAEEIKVYGAKAVVPATYTAWMPNYAYTYIFKISDNSNGWTSQTITDPQGLFPITFDAVVTQFVDANAEQATITTVATPSITTYQQGHTTATNEYSKSQKAGVSTSVKDVYVQVMDNSGATPTLVSDLDNTNSLLYKVSEANASEAEVMTVLTDRTTALDVTTIVGRNGITLTQDANIDNTVTSIVNGIDDKPITVSAGQAAEINISALATGTYAYVYATTVPTSAESIYALDADPASNYANLYEVACPADDATVLPADSKAVAGHVYFVKNTDTQGTNVTYTFKQTKVGDDVTGLVDGGTVPATKATSYTAGKFYFDVFNQNNGKYAVKVIKVVA